jgi:hypothetical protein
MGHAPFITTRLVTLDADRDHLKKRKGIFAIILEALHHSRRLQAERIIRQYHHLLASSEPGDSKPKAGGQ